MSLTHFKGGLNPDRLQGGLSTEDLLVSLNPSGHLPPLSTPPPAMPALLLSSHNPGANPGPACPGLSLSCFPWIQRLLSHPPPPSPHSSHLQVPKGRSCCVTYLIESILSFENVLNPLHSFFSKYWKTEAQRNQESFPDATAKGGSSLNAHPWVNE